MSGSISRLLGITLKAHGACLSEPGALEDGSRSAGSYYWNENFFGLVQSSLWRGLSQEQKNAVLRKMSRNLLAEAYHIECAGMQYSAKMNRLSMSEDERAFYCLMGAEEAIHRSMLMPFMDLSNGVPEVSSFGRLIQKIVATTERRSSLFLIQVLLEGWGIDYYGQLAEHSRSPELTSSFQTILMDETRQQCWQFAV